MQPFSFRQVEKLRVQQVPMRRRGFRLHWLRLFVVTLLLAVVVESILWMGQRIFLRKTVADWGTIKHQTSAEVLFLRKEKILTAPIGGRIYPAVKAGSRVRRGTVLAEIIDPRREGALSPEERRLLVSEYGALAEIEANIQGINNELKERYEQRTYLRRKEDVPGQLQVEREIARLIQEKTRLTEDRRKSRRVIGERVGGEWDRYYACLVAQESGIFWPALDGGETLPEGEGYLPVPLDFKRRFHPYAPILDGKVQEGRSIGKLVTGWEETVVAWVRPDACAFRPKPGQRCKILLPDGIYADLKFVSASAAPKGEFWIFRENSLVAQLLQKRRLRALLTVETSAGVRLPKNALWKRKDGFVVLTPDKSRRKELPVTVVDANDQWALVKGIDLGTLILYR